MTFLSVIFVSRDDLLTHEARIEILDSVTNQTRTFVGSGTMEILIQYPQVTTDWKRRFEIHAYRKRVSQGRFRMPARFYNYVEHPGCIEAGCIATFSFEGRDSSNNQHLFCHSVDFTGAVRKDKNAIVVRCDF